MRLESANKKLIEAYKHDEDTDSLEQFQITLNGENEFIYSKISELKILKGEMEKRCRDLEATQSRGLHKCSNRQFSYNLHGQLLVYIANSYLVRIFCPRSH